MNTRNRELSEFAMQEPEMGAPAEMDAGPGLDAGGPSMDSQPQPEMGGGGVDREGAMAKADLYKLASYAHKLYQQIEDEQQLEAWVQAKITKAADYIASVYHYLEYEMKFSEYGKHLDSADTLSESQKAALKGRLMEARAMVKQLKVAQAEKVAEASEKTPTTWTDKSGKKHPATSVKGDKYTGKEADKEAKKDKDLEEAAEKTPTTWTDKSGKKHPATSVKGDKYTGKEAEKESKGKKVDEATKTPSEWTDKSGKKHPATQVKGDKYTGKEAEKESKSKKDKDLDEATKTPTTWTDKSGKKHPATSVKGDKYTGKEAEKETKSKELDEAKPSAGLSKAKKSAVVKKAEAGKDIGKPGKNFAKVAKKAGGGEKGEKIAAAAMWKNIKEAVKSKQADKDYDGDGKIESGADEHKGSVDKAIKASKAKETVKESVETSRMREQLGRLNRSESHQLVESSEADQIRALTKRLLG